MFVRISKHHRHPEREDREFVRCHDKPISCEPEPLLKQAAGCLASYIANSEDVSSDSVHDLEAVICKIINDALVEKHKTKIVAKAIERQRSIETKTGVRIGKECIIVTNNDVDKCGMDIDRTVIRADFFGESPRSTVQLE